jgi:hypothetical protein
MTPRQLRQEAPKKSRWQHAYDDFELWLGLTGFVAEVPFRGLNGKRRWRWDWARLGVNGGVAVEYHGRHSEQSGHTSVTGTRRDYAKTTEGQLCGFTVIQCCAETVENGECIGWIEMALRDTAP